MSAPAIQLASVCNDSDAKDAGMWEVINGGTTSIGAQLRKWQHAQLVPDPFQLMSERPMTIHCVVAAGDFPAMASMLPFKGSTSAHQYDRKSTLDDRSPKYETPFSLLDPEHDGFKRRDMRDIVEAVNRAAQDKRKTYREDIMTDVGLNADDFIFHADGTWEAHFALAGVPHLDWLNGNSHDIMHTSLQGPVPLEIGLQQYVFIRVRKYYNRQELHAAKREYGLPPGASVPDFGVYIEEGRAGNLPDFTGRAKFTAAQSRVWLEHGTSIMEIVFKKKVGAMGRVACALAARVAARCCRVACASACSLLPRCVRVCILPCAQPRTSAHGTGAELIANTHVTCLVTCLAACPLGAGQHSLQE